MNTSKKISELIELTTADNNDVLVINDVSASETKKITLKNIFSMIYPINSIIIKDDNTDYSNWLGFTWQKVFAGRVLVGQDTSDTDFDTIGETGGEKTHTLTTSEIPEHNHSLKMCASTGLYASVPLGNGANPEWATSTNTISNTGGGQAHNNLQPYQVVAYWKRIS